MSKPAKNTKTNETNLTNAAKTGKASKASKEAVSPAPKTDQSKTMNTIPEDFPRALPLSRLRWSFDRKIDADDDDAGARFQSLRDSVKVLGVERPIEITGPDADGIYDVCAGRRRSEAAKLEHGENFVVPVSPAMVYGQGGKGTKLGVAFRENYLRKDLEALEKCEQAHALLVERAGTDEKAQKKVKSALAAENGLSASNFANLIRAATKLTDDAKAYARENRVSLKLLFEAAAHDTTTNQILVMQGKAASPVAGSEGSASDATEETEETEEKEKGPGLEVMSEQARAAIGRMVNEKAFEALSTKAAALLAKPDAAGIVALLEAIADAAH